MDLDYGSSMDHKSERTFRAQVDRAVVTIGSRDFDAFGEPLQVYANLGDEAEVFLDGIPVDDVTWADARRGIICDHDGGSDFPRERRVDPGRIKIKATRVAENASAAKAHILAESIGGTVHYDR